VINLVALIPALLTAAALGTARWALGGTPTRVRVWSARGLVLWAALAVVALAALLVGLHLQQADLAVWSAFALIATTLAAVTAAAVRLTASFIRTTAA
jgi:hypothetical protein